ncbi:MAG TPA: translation elongation factor Ts [Mycobacteriales bacterium]|nr:translation elongation factor Ts [Mycobacteriales bacterium]
MATISAADIKKLREATGAGMSDCKNALVEADGDYDKAMEQLRVKGLKGVAKRESRSASNGLVTAHLDADGSGVLLELNCETDFVAKGEKFQQVAQHVVERLVAMRPEDLEGALAADSGDGRTLKEFLDEANATLGEKIELRRFASFATAYVGSYLHKTSPDLPPQVGVLVEFSGAPGDIARDVAQHIAAFSPVYVSRDEVPEDVVAKEREIAEATAREEGKPEAALDKIVEGRVTGFFKEATLLEQTFAKDSKKSVKQVLDEAGVTVTRFARYRVGQA